jgi:Zn-dependent peptidase ImmA (M78 family)
VIGRQIAERRARLGLSVEEVGRLSHLSPVEVTAAERDDAEVSISTLEALGQALAFDPAVILRGESLPDARRMPGWFLSHAGEEAEAVSPHDARLFAVAAELGRTGAFLRELVGDPPPALGDLRGDLTPIDAEEPWRLGYRLGEQARQNLALAHPALRSDAALVSVQKTLEDLGVHVAHVSFYSLARYAVSIVGPGVMPIVLLNLATERSAQRVARRAVLAHELSHLLHDSGEAVLPSMPRQPTPYVGAVEQRANAFAPAFLAPPSSLREALVGAPPDDVVRTIAVRWGLMAEGAIWHAKNCGFISSTTAEELVSDTAFRRDVSRRACEAAAWEPDIVRDDARDQGLDVDTTSLVAGLVQDLVLRALRGGLISSGRAKELLTLA